MGPSEKGESRTRSGRSERFPSLSLQKVRRGEMTLDEYLDESTEEAVARVKHLLGPEDLEILRETLREHVRTDPVVVEMIRQMSGQTPEFDLDSIER